MKKMLLAVAVFVASAMVVAGSDSIEDRIKPVGELCMAGDSCAAAPVQVAAAGPRSGEDVYSSKCAMCHTTGVSGAPKLGDAAGWSDRLAKGSDTLYANAINGINGMPAMGLCFDCSEEEIKAAVDHMLASLK